MEEHSSNVGEGNGITTENQRRQHIRRPTMGEQLNTTKETAAEDEVGATHGERKFDR